MNCKDCKYLGKCRNEQAEICEEIDGIIQKFLEELEAFKKRPVKSRLNYVSVKR